VVVRIIEHMFRSYQYVLHPTARQGRALDHLLAVQCEAYNAALEERREAATIQCADVPARPLPPTGRQAGFDLGVANLATSSEGEAFADPRDLARGKKRWRLPSRRSPARSGARIAAAERGRRCPTSTEGSPTAAGTASTSSPGDW